MPDLISSLLQQPSTAILKGRITSVNGSKKYTVKVGSISYSVTSAVSETLNTGQSVIVSSTQSGKVIIGLMKNSVGNTDNEVIING